MCKVLPFHSVTLPPPPTSPFPSPAVGSIVDQLMQYSAGRCFPLYTKSEPDWPTCHCPRPVLSYPEGLPDVVDSASLRIVTHDDAQ